MTVTDRLISCLVVRKCYMGHEHFVFRLTEESAALILTALQEKFARADDAERRKIAGVTIRLKRKLQNLNVTKGGQ